MRSQKRLHKCRNRHCCNPEHLELETHQDNMDDKVKVRDGQTATPNMEYYG